MPGAFNPTPYVPGTLADIAAQLATINSGNRNPFLGDVKPDLDPMQLGRIMAAERMGMELDEYDEYLNGGGMYGREFDRPDK
jgi:hypothetical protein